MQKCLCLIVNLRGIDTQRYERKGDTIWRIYKTCPVHGHQAIVPVWSGKYGWLTKTKAATSHVSAVDKRQTNEF